MEDYDADRKVWLGPGGRSLARLGVRLARYYGHSHATARYKRDHAVNVRKLCNSNTIACTQVEVTRCWHTARRIGVAARHDPTGRKSR